MMMMMVLSSVDWYSGGSLIDCSGSVLLIRHYLLMVEHKKANGMKSNWTSPSASW